MINENPFRMKGVAQGEVFFNRTNEIKDLLRRARGGQHTLVMAPRKLGKSSLLLKVIETLKKNYSGQSVYVDLFMVSNVGELSRNIIKSVIAAHPVKAEKFFTMVRKLIPRVAPKLSLSGTGDPEISVDIKASGVGLDDVKDVLTWFDSSGSHNLIVLDEIQEIVEFPDSDKVEKKLRAIIQQLKNTTVFYSGSLPTVLREMFSSRGRAFFQSALNFDLGFAPLPEVAAYLNQGLKKLNVTKEFAEQLAEVSRGHPYYVQLLGYLAYERWNDSSQKKNVQLEQILEDLFRIERNAFENAIVALTQQQRIVYRAIARDPDQLLTSGAFLSKHDLPTHSSVRKAAQKLETLGYILKGKSGYFASDPMLALWWGRG